MTTFIALIRGINVGGHKQLAMSELKAACESLGYTNVRTLLNSGNVVFEATKAAARQLEEKIGARVILLSPAELDQAIAANPLRSDDPARLVLMVLEREPAATLEWPGPEQIHLSGRHLYLFYPNGQGRSKLTNALIERRLDVAGTARNWNTVLKLSALSHPEK